MIKKINDTTYRFNIFPAIRDENNYFIEKLDSKMRPGYFEYELLPDEDKIKVYKFNNPNDISDAAAFRLVGVTNADIRAYRTACNNESSDLLSYETPHGT